MKIRAIKHLNNHKPKGYVWEVTEEMGNTMISKGLCENADKKEAKPAIENKEEKKKPATKAKKK